MTNNERLPALLLKMKALQSKFSKAELRAVEYIMQHPEEVIYLSVAGLAEQSGVSEATIVRACRRLGLEGYQDLKVTLAQDLVTPLQGIHEEIKEGDDANTIITKVFQGTLHALNFTHDTLKPASIEQAAEKIMRARGVMVMGLGNSHSVAIDLQHKLLRVGIRATAHTDSHMQAIAAAYTTPDDVIFSISHSGSSRDIVDNTAIAKENGSFVISLTNIGSSPLSKLADLQLFTASKETQYRIVSMNSRIAQMTIIDSIYTIIAYKRPEIAEGFHRIYKGLQNKKY